MGCQATSPACCSARSLKFDQNRLTSAMIKGMTSNSFDRWNPSHPYSLAMMRFRQDFTTLNDYYWGTAASISAVLGKLNHLTNENDFRKELGLLSARFEKPLGHATGVFAEQVKKSEKWHRRAVIVMLASAFEQYMTTVTTLAVTSNPTLSRELHLLDGVALLKHDIQIVKHDVVDVNKGTWSTRYSAFKRLFGANRVLEQNIGELDRMRRDRNAIAHSFGVEPPTTGLSPHAMLILGARRTSTELGEVAVSEKRLVKLFDEVHRSAEAVDRQLMREQIGSYEPAALYLEWRSDPQRLETNLGMESWNPGRSKERNAKGFLTSVLGTGVTVEYVRSLEKYLGDL